MTIDLSVGKKYAEMLSIGFPKKRFSGYMEDGNILDLHQIIGNHVSWESTLVASLVNVGGRLRSVDCSTCFV